MKFKKIEKKRLFKKALEDGIKKAVELVVIGLVAGLSLKLLMFAVLGVVGGSLYRQDSQTAALRIKRRK
jgi:hypothetical protein